MKQNVYFDSTIPSYFFDNRESLRPFAEITRLWIQKESMNYSIWISPETIAELAAGRYPNQENILAWIAQFPSLPLSQEVLDIASIYIKNFLMPQGLRGDAVHLALASYYKIDYLLTWNCNHLANANKRAHLRIINARLNLPVPEITTPLELFKEEF